MKKEGKRVSRALNIIGIVALISILNTFFLIKNNKSITGFSIKEDIYSSFNSLPTDSKIFLLVQWAVIIFLVIYILIKEKMTTILKNNRKIPNAKPNLEKSKTELDSLYNLLETKKEMSLSSITKEFNIPPSLAMEWGKLLETGELITIYNGSSGEPVMKLKEKI